MSKDTSIDDIFKDGLSGNSFSNREPLWDKMEHELDRKKRKKKVVVFIENHFFHFNRPSPFRFSEINIKK